MQSRFFGGVLNIRVFIIFICLLGGTYGAFATDYYVDTASLGGRADDTNPGSKEVPWKTLGRAFGTDTPCPTAGDTIYVRDGVYKETVVIMRGGAPDKPLVFKVFPGEEAVIDGEGIREYGISLPGARPDYLKGVMIPENGSADHVSIDGFRLVNFNREGPLDSRYRGRAVSASGRKGVVIQNVEIANTRFGVFFNACANCRLTRSNIHHCYASVQMQSPCTDIVIDNNEIHHALDKGGCGVCMEGATYYVIFEGKLSSIETAGVGLARFTTSLVTTSGGGKRQALLNNAIPYTTRLMGQGDVDAGTVKVPNYLLLFFNEVGTGADHNEQDIVPGGTAKLHDGRKWFALRNNAEWADKPFSPDGMQGLFETGQAKIEELGKAKYFYICQYFDMGLLANRDIQILSNHIYDCAHQGILLRTNAEHTLVRGNRIHDCANTGLQVESGARHLWIENNEIYANSQLGHETSLWVDEDIDIVIQNNLLYESHIGLYVSQCSRILSRRNVICNNRGQHNMFYPGSACKNSTGITINGGHNTHLGAPPTVTECAFVHNTLYDNGVSWSTTRGCVNYGGFGPIIGRNIVLNNMVQHARGKSIMWLVRQLPLLCDGNLYHSIHADVDITYVPPEAAAWLEKKEVKEVYPIAKAEDFSVYQKRFGLDQHSRVAEATFVNPEAMDFHLAKGSAGIDEGVPLTMTTSPGKGNILPVANVWCFSAGFKNSKGEQLIAGDEIMVGKEKARVMAVDWDKKTLALDRNIEWEKNTPVNYVYLGDGPDIGAFESEGSVLAFLKFLKHQLRR